AARTVEEGERRGIREGDDQRFRVADATLRRRHHGKAHVVQEEAEGVGAGAIAVGMVDGEGDGGGRDRGTRRGGEPTTQQGGQPEAPESSAMATHGVSSARVASSRTAPAAAVGGPRNSVRRAERRGSFANAYPPE